jgi:hypothetical protein
MIDTDIGWDIVKVGETELSDDDLKMIVNALWRRSDHWSDLAEDDDYLSRRADRRLRMRNKNNPEMTEASYLSFFKAEIRGDCEFKSRELRRLSELFFEVSYERTTNPFLMRVIE